MKALLSTQHEVILLEKYETANWSLRQGDEEVDERVKQKIYI